MKWTFENCKIEAKKYNTRNDFCINSPSAYTRARKNKWLDEICSHMKTNKKPYGYWTKERCKIEAKKYNCKLELRKKSISCYSIIVKNKWIDEMCSHMKKANNDSKRCIYAYEFNDNYVYIGLTNNLKDRNRRHKKSGTVYNYIQINSNYKLIQLTEYLDIETAKEKEEYYVNYYKELNWNILNKTKTGSLGSNIIKWTFENCKIEAKKYKYVKNFRIKSSAAYNSARKNKWLDEICSHMIYLHEKWSKEKCQKNSIKCDSKKIYREKYSQSYKAAYRNGWLDEICSHMK